MGAGEACPQGRKSVSKGDNSAAGTAGKLVQADLEAGSVPVPPGASLLAPSGFGHWSWPLFSVTYTLKQQSPTFMAPEIGAFGRI